MGLLDFTKGITKKEICFVLLLFLLAFAIRGHNLKYQYFFEFDSYYHARMTSYVIQDGIAPARDPLAYYQLGGATLPAVGVFFWHFNAAIYKLVTLGGPYNKELWIAILKFLPALYGAITCIAMYFFLKNVFGKKYGSIAGATAAIIAASIPAFAYRTMAGWYEPASFGFMWMVIGFWFFAKAIREPTLQKANLFNAGLAGLFFGLMAGAWSFFLVVPMLLFLYFIFGLIKFYAQHTFEEFKAFIALNAIAFVILSALGMVFRGPNWIVGSLEFAANGLAVGSLSWPILYAFIGLSALGLIALYVMKRNQNSETPQLSLVLGILLYVAVIILAITFTDPNSMFERAFRPDTVLSQTIGEESKGFPAFGEKFGIMIVLPILALLIIPWRIYKKKEEHLSLLLYFWIMITFFMAYFKLQYTFTFGLPIAAAGAVIAVELMELFEKRKGIEVKLLALGMGLILLCSIAAGTSFMNRQEPSIEQWTGWKEALTWIKDNTPTDAKMFNWWDEGHWIAFLGERKVFLDNRNFSSEGDQEYAQFVTTTDVNHALEILRKNKPDYILVEQTLFGSQGSYLQYGYWTTHLNEVSGLAPKLAGYAGFSMSCSPSGDKVTCENGNEIPLSGFNSLATTWTDIPSQVENGRIPQWYYRNSDNSAVFVLGSTLNDTVLAKMWFHEPTLENYFEEVYSNVRLKIFKVNTTVYNN